MEYILQLGTCSVKLVCVLYYKNKNKLISNMSINRNVMYRDNLSKQKVSLALALFSENLTTALRDGYKV